jgi:hypothetical protein
VVSGSEAEKETLGLEEPIVEYCRIVSAWPGGVLI